MPEMIDFGCIVQGHPEIVTTRMCGRHWLGGEQTQRSTDIHDDYSPSADLRRTISPPI